jgi:hypothetical protein
MQRSRSNTEARKNAQGWCANSQSSKSAGAMQPRAGTGASKIAQVSVEMGRCRSVAAPIFHRPMKPTNSESLSYTTSNPIGSDTLPPHPVPSLVVLIFLF